MLNDRRRRAELARPGVPAGTVVAFHGWTEESNMLYAVVELPDGQVEEVAPPALRFLPDGDRPR